MNASTFDAGVVLIVTVRATKKNRVSEREMVMSQDYKKMTRTQAEKAISRDGVDAATELHDHPNYHVRRKAWVKCGSHLPESEADRKALFARLNIKEYKGLVMS